MDARADIAKIKIAAKQLGIRDDDGADGSLSTYRQLLLKLTGKTSIAGDVMSDRERAKVLHHLQSLGFKAGPRRKPAKAPGMVSRGQVEFMKRLWRALGDGGALHDTSLDGLKTWVLHSTQRYNSGAGYNAPEFLPATVARELIEKLKLWLKRKGIDWRAP